MKNYHDLRAVRSRQMIRDAFIGLLERKRYDEITISELAKAANINRVTFYLHYRDLDDFITQLVDELIEELYEFVEPLNDEPYEPGFELEALTRLLEFIAEHERVYRMMFVSKDVPYFTPRMVTFFRELMVSYPQLKQGQHFLESGIEADIASWYGTSALIGTISLWLGEGMPHPPRHLAEQIVRLNPFRT